MIEDTRLWPLSTELASCLCRELAAQGGPETCFCGVIPGDAVAYDFCAPCGGDRCGMAWVRLTSVVPLSTVAFGTTGQFPSSRCAVPLAGIFEVGVLRCAPTLGEGAEPPDVAIQLESAQMQAADMAASGRAAACCFTGRFVEVAGWAPLGPSGGCLGGFWTVTVGEF